VTTTDDSAPAVEPLMFAAADPALAGFVLNEAALLDERRYERWLELLTDDFEYLVPMPLVREDPELPAYDERAWVACETKETMALKLLRASSDYAWADRPAPFTRRFVSNVRAMEYGDGLLVHSNVLVSRTRRPAPPSLFSAGRHDVLVPVGTSWRLRHRTVYLDNELTTGQQISFVY
jgi:3-phenylpropionate/cinnamic acid dioxygenase small subunit